MSAEDQTLIRLSPKDKGEVTRSETLIRQDLKKHGEDLVTEYARTGDAQSLDLGPFLEDIEDISALDGPDQPRFAPALTSMGMDPIIRNAFITRLADSQEEYDRAIIEDDEDKKLAATKKFQRELWLAAILRLDEDGGNPNFQQNSAVVAELLEEFLTQEPLSTAPETEDAIKPVIRVGGYSEGKNQQPNPRAKLDDATAVIIQLDSDIVQIPKLHEEQQARQALEKDKLTPAGSVTPEVAGSETPGVTSKQPTDAAQETARRSTIVDRVNEVLQRSLEKEAIMNIGLSELEDYLNNNPLPNGIKLENLHLSIIFRNGRNILTTLGQIIHHGRNGQFDTEFAWLETASATKLINYNYADETITWGGGYVPNLEHDILAAVDSLIDPSWQTSAIDLGNNQDLIFYFTRRP